MVISQKLCFLDSRPEVYSVVRKVEVRETVEIVTKETAEVQFETRHFGNKLSTYSYHIGNRFQCHDLGTWTLLMPRALSMPV